MIEIRKPGVGTVSDSRLQYDVLYSDQGIRLLDSFYVWILGLLPIKPGARLLDISCGEGSLLHFAARSGFAVYGLDLSLSAVEVASQRSGVETLVVGDGEVLPFPDEHFDFVTNIGSLEHYLHPDAGVREVARVLKPTGLACILLPNLFGLLWNVYWVWKSGSMYVDDQPIQRYATRNHWTGLLEANGLKVVRVHRDNRPLPRTWGDLWWYLKRPRKFVATLFALGIPTNLANCQVFICTRADGIGNNQ
ncbi:MAG: class I SAM-dependent methyltransferase [Chloroflexi bacterium]|nr:class I SAM-dependent methyltransferase [Chloroflexota bacterium]